MKPEEVLAVIDALAKRLGTTADFLIPLFARRQVGGALAELVAVVALCCLCLRAYRWRPSEDAVDDSDGWVYLLKWALVVIPLAVGSVYFVDVMMILASPEAAAIKEIISAIHGS